MVVLVFSSTQLRNEENVVTDLLEELKRDFEGEEYTRRLESRARKEGYVALGFLGEATALDGSDDACES